MYFTQNAQSNSQSSFLGKEIILKLTKIDFFKKKILETGVLINFHATHSYVKVINISCPALESEKRLKTWTIILTLF